MHDFSVDHNSVDKSYTMNIHKYLMTKNNIKSWSVLLKKCLLYYWVLKNQLATKYVFLNDEPCMARPN